MQPIASKPCKPRKSYFAYGMFSEVRAAKPRPNRARTAEERRRPPRGIIGKEAFLQPGDAWGIGPGLCGEAGPAVSEFLGGGSLDYPQQHERDDHDNYHYHDHDYVPRIHLHDSFRAGRHPVLTPERTAQNRNRAEIP
jgi:hypothetical protein